MLKLFLTLLVFTLLIYFVSPGWFIGVFLGLIEFLVSGIAWWQFLLIIIGIALLRKLRKAKK